MPSAAEFAEFFRIMNAIVNAQMPAAEKATLVAEQADKMGSNESLLEFAGWFTDDENQPAD